MTEYLSIPANFLTMLDMIEAQGRAGGNPTEQQRLADMVLKAGNSDRVESDIVERAVEVLFSGNVVNKWVQHTLSVFISQHASREQGDLLHQKLREAGEVLKEEARTEIVATLKKILEGAEMKMGRKSGGGLPDRVDTRAVMGNGPPQGRSAGLATA